MMTQQIGVAVLGQPGDASVWIKAAQGRNQPGSEDDIAYRAEPDDENLHFRTFPVATGHTIPNRRLPQPLG